MTTSTCYYTNFHSLQIELCILILIGDFIQKVSIIIPIHNEEETIEKTLRSVIGQKMVGEIIVVDDYSTDKTPEILKKYKKKLKIIRNKKNLGLSKSLNIGLKNSKFDYVCTLHGDCVLPRNWFERQMHFFSGNIAVVTSKIVLPKKVWNKFDFWNKIFFSKFLKPRKIICENKCDIYKKNVIEKIGFFSKYFRVAGEDFDLYCKLKKMGYEVYCSDIIVEHHMSSHQKGFWKYFKKELQYGEARGVILRKHRFLILFNPFAFKLFPDVRFVIALPIVIVFKMFSSFYRILERSNNKKTKLVVDVKIVG